LSGAPRHDHLSSHPIHRPSSAIPLTTTTTISLPPPLSPTFLHFSLSLTIIVSSPQHTPIDRESHAAATTASPRLEAPASKFDAPVSISCPTPSSSHRHLCLPAITTNHHDHDTAITHRPLAVCHARIGLSPIIPCDRLRLATPLHDNLPRHWPITSIHLA
jgi:hypothetical protein